MLRYFHVDILSHPWWKTSSNEHKGGVDLGLKLLGIFLTFTLTIVDLHFRLSETQTHLLAGTKPFEWGSTFQTKCCKSVSLKSRKRGQTASANTWGRWPTLTVNSAKNVCTKWDSAPTAPALAWKPSAPIMHMTCICGTARNKRCTINSGTRWTPHNENALQRCRARCFNGLVSAAIIVNTSQQRCSEQWRSGSEHIRSGRTLAHLWRKVSYEQKIRLTEPRSEQTKKNRWHISKWDFGMMLYSTGWQQQFG